MRRWSTHETGTGHRNRTPDTRLTADTPKREHGTAYNAPLPFHTVCALYRPSRCCTFAWRHAQHGSIWLRRLCDRYGCGGYVIRGTSAMTPDRATLLSNAPPVALGCCCQVTLREVGLFRCILRSLLPASASTPTALLRKIRSRFEPVVSCPMRCSERAGAAPKPGS